MLSYEQIVVRLNGIYSDLLKRQAYNERHGLHDELLECKVATAYGLIKIIPWLTIDDISKWVDRIEGVCNCDLPYDGNGPGKDDNANGEDDEDEDKYQWLGVDGICEDEEVFWKGVDLYCVQDSGDITPPQSTTSSTSTTTLQGQITSTTTNNNSTTTSSSSTTTQFIPVTTSTSTTTTSGTETTIVPPWLSSLAMSVDAGTHETSIYNNTTQSTDLRIQSTDGSIPSGNTSDGGTWTNGQWIPGTTVFAAPFSRVFRLNPTINGIGGLIPGSTYKVSLRRTNDNSLIFVKNITIPLVSQSITDIPLSNTTSSTSTTSQVGQTTSTTTVTMSTSTTSSTSTTTISVGDAEFIQDGKRITLKNGVYTAIINSQYTKLSVLSNGNLKLTYTQPTRPAENGIACVPVTMFSYMTDDYNGELAALLSPTGLALRKGTKGTLFTYWTDPSMFTKLSEVSGNELWLAWGQPPSGDYVGSARDHNGGADWCSFEIY